MDLNIIKGPTNNFTATTTTIVGIKQESILEVVTNIDAGVCGEGNGTKYPVAISVKIRSVGMNIRK